MGKFLVWFLFLLTIKLSSGEGDSTDKPEDNKATDTENVGKAVKQPEKRGTLKVTVIPGAAGQQNVPFRYIYSNQQPLQYSTSQPQYSNPQPQQSQYSYQQPQYTYQPQQYSSQQPQYSNQPRYSNQQSNQYANQQYSNPSQYDTFPKPVATISTPVKYELKQYSPQQLVLPTNYPTQPLPYPTPMLLVLAQHSPSGPYSFMLLPQGLTPYNYVPNPYPSAGSLPVPYPTGPLIFGPQQRVAYVIPQFVAPKTPFNYLNHNSGFVAAQQLLHKQKEPTYHDQESRGSESVLGKATQSPSYGNRVRPLEQQSKG